MYLNTHFFSDVHGKAKFLQMMNELKGAYEKGEEELKVAKTRSELTDYWTKEIISDLTMSK